MPAERDSRYPDPVADDVDNAPGGREIKAARNIVSRKIMGIPKRAYVLGDCDHAVVVQGVEEFTTVVYALLDAIADEGSAARLSNASVVRLNRVKEMMQDHRCPVSRA